MGSLTAHLLEAGDHGRLRFHPSCPVCRQERLYGSLSSEPVVSRRAQALLAGGVLAFSTSAPAVALAQEPDRQFEGVATPENPGGPELDDPSFDPGGDTALSFDTAPAPAAPDVGVDSGDGAPLDVEPTVDLDARLVPIVEPGTPVTEEQAAVPPAETVPPGGSAQPTESGAPAPDATPPGGSGAAPGGTTTPDLPHDGREAVRLAAHGDALRARAPHAQRPVEARYTQNHARSDAGAPASSHRVSDGAGAPPEPAAAPVTAPLEDNREPPPLARDSRFYVVQPGDSLWSIAKRLLGRDASAGLIAREVNRLWTVNRSRIATGDPDLLIVGTKLELR